MFSYLPTLTTWHCPHSPAAAPAIDRYFFPAGPAAANFAAVAHAGTDRRTDAREMLSTLWECAVDDTTELRDERLATIAVSCRTLLYRCRCARGCNIWQINDDNDDPETRTVIPLIVSDNL